MRRRLAVSLSASLAVLFMCASVWLSSITTVSAEPPPRTPVLATETAQAAAANHAEAAAIVLRAPGAPATAWTVVQWQDGLGGWHDVDGWRGDLDAGQQKVWWVLPKDYNTGPFRWVVLEQRDGPVWSTSTSFTLPASDSQRVFVEAMP